MEQLSDSASVLIMAGIIVLAIFYLSMIASFIPHVLRLYKLVVAKIIEYQALDRGDLLTLLIDAGLNHNEALRFHDIFYATATRWERCLIKLYIKKHCF